MKKTALLALALLAPSGFAQPGPRGTPAATPGPVPAGGALAAYVASLPKEPLSDAESALIVFTREEEKLARDVYRALFAAWGDRSFANIAEAEQRHMDDVKLLLDRYGVADPAAATSPGEFKDTRLATLYAELVAKGKVSLVEAMKVGATIEDLDLADVGKGLGTADNRDVDAVLQNLAKGSRNHLRAFSRRLAALGGTFAAQYLTADEVAAILAAQQERGAYDENGKLLAGTCAGRGAGGRGRGRGRGDGTGPNCPKG